MKKRIKIIFLLLMFLPFIVNASSTINGGKEKANNYITSFENYKKYILFPTDSSKYAYEENGYNSVNGNGFLKGGFISATEYRISIHGGSSWLSPGIGYWTLTKGSNNEYYYISNSLSSKNMNEQLSVRVTEYVQPSTVIKGKGTTTNPWYFVEAFTVRLKSNNENYGNLLANENTEEQILFVERNSTKSVNYTLTPGYDISKSNLTDCDTKYFNVDNNKLTIKSVDRDLSCTINFEPKTYTVTLNAMEGILSTKALSVTYSQKYGEIPTPTKEGFVFEGWFTSSTGGTKITNETIVTETKDHTLYAHWRVDRITFSNLTCVCANTPPIENPLLTYTGECEIVKENTDDWKIRFLTSGTLTSKVNLDIDIFLVGGGGASGSSGDGVWGGGGGGGYTKTFSSQSVNSGVYIINIGAGGQANTCSKSNISGPKITKCSRGSAQRGESSYISFNGTKLYEAEGGYGGSCGVKGSYFGSGHGSCKSGLDDMFGGAGGSAGGTGWTNMYCKSMYKGASKGKSKGSVPGQGYSTCEFSSTTDKEGSCPSGIAYSAGGDGACETDVNEWKSKAKAGEKNTGNGGSGHGSFAGGSGIVIFRNKR